MDRFRGGDRDLYEDAAPIFMRYASGHSGIMRFFLRDGIEERGGEGRWGWSMNTVQPETQETGEGGAVSASPLPVSPSSTGRFSHRHSVTGGDHYFAVSPDTP